MGLLRRTSPSLPLVGGLLVQIVARSPRGFSCTLYCCAESRGIVDAAQYSSLHPAEGMGPSPSSSVSAGRANLRRTALTGGFSSVFLFHLSQVEAVRGTAAVRNGRRCSNSPTLASVRSCAALLVRPHEREDTVPWCVVGWDGLWEEVEIGLPSFLYPSPPAVTGRGQETGSVCANQGTCLCSFFLIANSFSVTCASSRAYTPQKASLQFPSFFPRPGFT